MKRILSVLFILVSFASQAQNQQTLGAKNTVLKTPGALIADSVFNLRLLDTATSKLAYPSFLLNRLARQNGRIYIYNGTGFVLADSVTGSGGVGTVSSFSFTDGNGFDGTVTNSTTTPTLVLTTQANNNFVTDAQLVVLGNTSGTNTGDQTSVTGNAGTATTLQTGRTIGIMTGDVVSSGSTFNGSANNTNAVTLATVNSNVGSFGSATAVPAITVNGKGLVTGVTSTSIQIAQSQVTSLTGDLAAKAPLASPTFTGTVATPNLTVTSLSSGSTNDSILVADASTGAVKRVAKETIQKYTVSLQSSSPLQTLTDGATTTWNANLGQQAIWTIGGTGRTLSITNPIAGTFYTLKLIQGTGGSKTITTYPTNTKWSGGTAPTLTTAAGSVDIISFWYDGTNMNAMYSLDVK